MGDDGDTELGMDMWTKAGDGSSSSAGFMDLNGTLDGSDCSSDSIVDVLKGWIVTHTRFIAFNQLQKSHQTKT